MIRSSPVLMPPIIMCKDASKGSGSQPTNFGALLAGISEPAVPGLVKSAPVGEAVVVEGENPANTTPAAGAPVVDVNTDEAPVPPVLIESVPALDSDPPEPALPVATGQVDAVPTEEAPIVEVPGQPALPKAPDEQLVAEVQPSTKGESVEPTEVLVPAVIAPMVEVPAMVNPPLSVVPPTPTNPADNNVTPTIDNTDTGLVPAPTSPDTGMPPAVDTQPATVPVVTAPVNTAPTATTPATPTDPTVISVTLPGVTRKEEPQTILAENTAADDAPQISIPASTPPTAQINDLRPTPELKEVKAPEPAAIKMIQEQLRGQIVRMVSDEHGNKLIKVRLHPEELGPVTVKATFESTGVRIELIPATETAREAIKVAIQDLRRDLLAHNSDASLDMGEERSGENPREPNTTQHHVETQSETPAPTLRVTEANEPDQFDRSV